MADKNTPIRLDISRQGAARAADPVSAAYRIASGIGDGVVSGLNTAADAFPGVAAARALYTGAQQPGVADAVEGLFGLTPGALTAAPLRSDVVPAGQHVMAEPLPAPSGNTPTTITPQEQSAAAISAILSKPFTLGAFKTATGALPDIATANGIKITNKDKVYGAASSVTDAIYQAELAQAQKLTGDAKDAAVLATTEKYRKNLLEINNVDPSKAALADILGQQGK